MAGSPVQKARATPANGVDIGRRGADGEVRVDAEDREGPCSVEKKVVVTRAVQG
jgi:hypothetical protein